MSVCITVIELSEQLHVKPQIIREFGRREKDPLPIRVLPGHERGQFLLVSDLEDWIARNAKTLAEA